MLGFVLRPLHVLVLLLAAQFNEKQQRVIEYLQAENQMLREKLGTGRIRLTNERRLRLAMTGKTLGRKAFHEIATIVTPDTILRWHRELVATKWDYSDRRRKVGRPPVSEEVVSLMVRFAEENPTWGYDGIQGALKNLGLVASDQTVGNTLEQHGIEPAP